MSKKSANKRMQLDVVQGNFNEKNAFVAEKGAEIKKGIVKQLTPEEIQRANAKNHNLSKEQIEELKRTGKDKELEIE